MQRNIIPIPPQVPETPPPPAEVAQRVLRLEGAQAGALIVLAIAASIAICYYGKLVIITLLVSLIFTLMLAPLVHLLMRIGMPRSVAALMVLLVLSALLFMGFRQAYNKAGDFARDLPTYSRRIRAEVGKYTRTAETVTKNTKQALPGNADRVVKVQQQAGWADYLTWGLGTATEILLTMTFIPFLVYFMLTGEDHARRTTLRLFERRKRRAAYDTLEQIGEMIRGFIVGNVIIGLFISAASAVAFALLHVPYWYFLAPLSGFLSLLPYLGVPLAAVPPLVALLGSDSFTGPRALGIIGVVVGAHLVALNVLYPKFLGGRVRLNPLVVTMSLLVWAVIWGAMGLLLAIPITAAMKIIFDHVEPLQPYGDWLGE